LALAKKLGIDGINPAACDAMAEFNKITDGCGFDVVFEASGSRAGILMTTDACRIRGTIVPMSLAGVPVEFVLGKVSFKELSVIGSRVYTFEHFKEGVKQLEKIASQMDLRPLVSDIIPLDEAQKAIDMMRSGKNKGKILIRCK
jgi:threonine dehydrogenase-like Zn-dependent dehydrogenase